MAETVTTARPSVAKPVSRLRSRTAETGSASALARHLDCSRTYIGKLEAEGEIQRKVTASHSIGAALPTCDTLRRERRQSPSSAVPLKLGNYMMNPAKAVHWDGFGGEEEVVVQVMGYGPSGMTPEDPNQPFWVEYNKP